MGVNRRILGLERALVREDFERLANSEESRLLAGYREMAADRQREAEAQEWCEELINDSSHQEA
jgi:hypothetical protein